MSKEPFPIFNSENLFRENEWTENKDTMELLDEVEEANAQEIGFQWD